MDTSLVAAARALAPELATHTDAHVRDRQLAPAVVTALEHGGWLRLLVPRALDGAAVAAVKWRAFGTNYRGGVLPDAFLDGRDVVPPASYWVGRAMVPPSRRHRLLVWGRPGTVYGYVDCGPAHPDDAGDRSDVGEVWELYVDPAAQGLGGGARLLAAASAWLDEVGLVHQELSVLRTNPAALAFYRRQGWQPTGAVRPVDLGVVAFEELRLRRGAAQVE